MASITVNRGAITHMENTTVSAMKVMNFEAMSFHVEVREFIVTHMRKYYS